MSRGRRRGATRTTARPGARRSTRLGARREAEESTRQPSEDPDRPASTRRAGLLLHPTSLPGPYPIGDLGPAAHALLDWLVDAGLSAWQLLPLGPTGYGDSPYHAHSSFAGNPLLVSPEALVADGLIAASDLVPISTTRQDQTNFPEAKDFKQRLHRRVRDLNAASLAEGSSLLASPFDELAQARSARRAPERAQRGRGQTEIDGGSGSGSRQGPGTALEAQAESLSPQWKPLVSDSSSLPAAGLESTAARSQADSLSLQWKPFVSDSKPENSANLHSTSTPIREESLSRQWNSFVSDPEVRGWLDDWALYAALKQRFGGKSWLDWDPELRDRKPRALESARRELADEVELAAFEQFLLFRQWRALRAAAEARGIELVGDLPIYPALDSADVWAHRDLFQLGRDGRPRRVAGVPPDYFSDSGQLWGNPLYRWDRLAATRYAWWVDRVRWQLRLFHRLRLDHFRGFVAFWDVPARATTAAKGRWSPGPGRALFDALASALGGGLPFVAEDLGEIDAPVHALRRRLGLPGMRVLQFGFAADDSLHAPHRHTADAVVYTGTHDNDTCRAWIAAVPDEVRHRALTYLGTSVDDLPWTMVRAAVTSAADLAIVPMQDLLGLGGEARMNTPAKESGNWIWRVRPEQIPADLPKRLRDLLQAASRRMPVPTAAAAPALAPPAPTG